MKGALFTIRKVVSKCALHFDKLEVVRFSSALPFYHQATASSIFVGIPNMVNAL